MITAAEIGLAPARPLSPPRAAAPAPAVSVSLRERVLRAVLFVAVLASSVAFIEPSPHDAIVLLLALACLVAGVRFRRLFALPLLLLVVWNASGLIALINAVGQEKTVQYAATSVYLAVAALLFACLFADERSTRRLPSSIVSAPERERLIKQARDTEFPVAIRGYDRAAVDRYVEHVNRLLAELEISSSPESAVRHALDDALHDGAMQRYFARDPLSWAARLYLSDETMSIG